MPADNTETWSVGALYEFTVAADGPSDPPIPVTPKELLRRMRSRLEVYGAPLPDGYVPPPGIDLPALLKQVPWPPPAGA